MVPCRLALAVLVLGSVQGKPVVPTSCSADIAPASKLVITSLTQTPDEPTWGSTVTFTVQGVTPIELDGGNVTMVAKIPSLSWFSIAHNSWGLCSLLGDGFSCPVQPGAIGFGFQITTVAYQFISWFQLTLSVQVVVSQADSTLISCIEFPVTLNPGPDPTVVLR